MIGVSVNEWIGALSREFQGLTWSVEVLLKLASEDVRLSNVVDHIKDCLPLLKEAKEHFDLVHCDYVRAQVVAERAPKLFLQGLPDDDEVLPE